MKELRFQRAQEGSVLFKPDGKGGHTRVADRSEWSTLRVKKKEADFFRQALQWACIDDLGFFCDPVPTEENGIVEISCPGRFSHSLSETDISQIIADWKLLAQHYPNYQDLANQGFDNKLTQTVIFFLIDKVQNKPADLPAWAARAISIKRTKED